ncbi:site-specific integrase [Photobacterium sanguinicancri]|uniref:Site-specific integrase n=1 Tax=Photobacterium sanguinicancri TaxID=875932 RepID=A0AAW7Y5P6_9GAMM|nr:site-specific integrase [Photobacterium sanguinicancri]MDO6543684.1 site-specific integrase [Photobacterium sanguinicancri]
MRKTKLDKTLERFNQYRKFRGVQERTIEADEEIIRRVLNLNKKSVFKWNRKNALDVYYKIHLYPVYAVHYKQLEGLKGDEFIRMADDLSLKRISKETEKRYLNVTKMLFRWLYDEGEVERDYFKDLKNRIDKRKPSEVRKSFELNHIKKIYDKLGYRNKDRVCDYTYWIPIIADELGLRQNEIAQLYKDDMQKVERKWCFVITDKRWDQRLKNKSSKRVIPISNNLIRLGLVDYILSQNERVFPELKYGRGGYADKVTDWFSAEMKKINIGDGYTFHSYRHFFTNRMKQSGVEDCIASEILGHSYGSLAYERYGKDYSVIKKKKIIDRNGSKAVAKLPVIYKSKNKENSIFRRLKNIF